jgi:hypothetical protein
MDAIKAAISSNTFDPNTEIPDLSGKVRSHIQLKYIPNIFKRSTL